MNATEQRNHKRRTDELTEEIETLAEAFDTRVNQVVEQFSAMAAADRQDRARAVAALYSYVDSKNSVMSNEFADFRDAGLLGALEVADSRCQVTALRARLDRFVQRLHEETPTNPSRLKDWPAVLKMNVAAAELAPSLYRSHSLAWRGTEPEPWQSLNMAVRHSWIQMAAKALKGLR